MRLRPSTYKDGNLIHDIRMQPSIDAFSHKKQTMIISHRNRDIGYIERKGHTVSIAIYPIFQGRGFGKRALKQFCKKGDEAEILVNNKQSMHTFEEAGFKPYATKFIKG